MLLRLNFARLFSRGWWRRQHKRKLYDSIEEMPIWNWMQVHETKKLKYLVITKNYKSLELENDPRLMDRWKELYDQYIGEFGIHDKYQDYLRQKIKIAKLQVQHIVKDDRTKEPLIANAENTLEQMLQEKEKIRYADVVVSIQRFLGFHINTREISVFEYYHYLKNLERFTKSARK